MNYEKIDLELGIIAMMYLDEKLEYVKLHKLDRELFEFDMTKNLFDKILKLRQESKPCDMMMLYNGCGLTREEAERLKISIDNATSLSNFDQHYNALLCFYNRAKADELIKGTVTLSEYHSAINKYQNIDEDIKIFSTRSDMVQMIEEIEDFIKGDFKRFNLGIPDLDAVVGDILEGTMAIVSARTSLGKTWFMLQVAAHLADKGESVLYLSCEMGKTKLMKRILQSKTGIRLKAGSKTELDKTGDYKRILNALTEIGDKDINIVELPYFDETKINGLIKSLGAKVVFLDYIQQFNFDSSSDTRAGSLSDISNGIKRMAQRHNLLVVAGSQQNRGGKDGDLMAIKESSAIAEASDIVIMLENHPETYIEAEKKIGYTFHVSKNRDGDTGKVPLSFSGIVGRFIPKSTIII